MHDGRQPKLLQRHSRNKGAMTTADPIFVRNAVYCRPNGQVLNESAAKASQKFFYRR
jgi:hypothetical protein